MGLAQFAVVLACCLMTFALSGEKAEKTLLTRRWSITRAMRVPKKTALNLPMRVMKKAAMKLLKKMAKTPMIPMILTRSFSACTRLTAVAKLAARPDEGSRSQFALMVAPLLLKLDHLMFSTAVFSK